jgi:tRNA 2-thiouridine synthesizing protein E
MLDILQTIDNEAFQQRDPHGYMAELEKWSVQRAEAMAQEDGLTLTRDHWEVIHLLREHYRMHGPSLVRDLAGGLEEHFMLRGGMKFLYTLFPRGPIVQASRIAGLPVPALATDRSFGTVH